MTQLLKDTAFSYTPGTPGTPGDPGTPSVPGYWRNVTSTTFGTVEYRSVTVVGGTVAPAGSDASRTYTDAGGVLRWRQDYTDILAVQTSPGTTTTTQVWVPPVPGTPPVPGIPGTASQTIADYKLGWNAGAVSQASQPSDCVLSLQVSASSIGVVAGLNSSNEGPGYTEIDYGFYFTHGRAAVYEQGVAKLAPVAFTGADVFKVQRLGRLVRYLKNDTVLYASTVFSAGPVFADASLYSGGDAITAASFGGAVAPWDSNGSAAGDLSPLGGISANKNYAESSGSLQALTGSSGMRGKSEALGSLSALAGLGANKPYAESRGQMAPLQSDQSATQLQPSYTLANGSMAPLLGTARVLSGEVSSISGVLTALEGLSSNKAYAESRGAMLPLGGFSAQAVQLNGYAFITAPMATLYAAVRDSTGENAADITAPMALVRASFGVVARVKAPMPTLAASVTGTNWLSAGITAPAGTVVASATASGVSQAQITAPMATAAGYGGMVLFVTPAGMPTVTASATSGGFLSASIVAPMAKLALFELSAGATSRANILAPAGRMGATLQAWVMAPMATLTAIGSATVAATYEAYSINLSHKARRQGEDAAIDETTRYTNFPFERIVRYQNSYFGMAADGLYLLEGTTDGGTAIPYTVKTCADDFGVPEVKSVASAYFGGRLGPAATVTLYAGETGQQSYAYDTPRGQAAQNHREKFGRGVKARYFALGLAGTGELELDDIAPETQNLSRRI